MFPSLGTAQYDRDIVSWPPVGSVAVPITEHLASDDSEFVTRLRETMLKSSDDISSYMASADRVKPFLEPTLVRRPCVYADFLHRLFDCGMIRFRVGGPSLLGVFFVTKSSGNSELF